MLFKMDVQLCHMIITLSIGFNPHQLYYAKKKNLDKCYLISEKGSSTHIIQFYEVGKHTIVIKQYKNINLNLHPLSYVDAHY